MAVKKNKMVLLGIKITPELKKKIKQASDKARDKPSTWCRKRIEDAIAEK